MMASGRPVLAITIEGNEVHRLIRDSECGLCVPPDDPERLAEALSVSLVISGPRLWRYAEQIMQEASRLEDAAAIAALLARFAAPPWGQTMPTKHATNA